jgi:hypothetical protein
MTLLKLTAIALALGLLSAAPAAAETIIDEWANVKPPAPPELKGVTLDPKTTAVLVIDLIK